jgi:hypothetical protein
MRICRVMRMIFLGAPHRLFEQRMRKPALDLDDNRLVLLVADYDSVKNAPWHDRYLFLASIPFRFGTFMPVLRREGFYPRDIAAHYAHPCGVFELPRCPLEAQIEPLFLEVQKLLLKLIL